VIEDAAVYRSKQQVLEDLSKALHFSPESLEANRAGRLSSQQIKALLPEFVRPAILTLFLAVGPLLIWTWVTAQRDQLPFENAFPALIKELVHVNDLMENHGTMGGIMMLGSIVISLLLAGIMVYRVPLLLYFDLLDRKVEAREGRVVAREEQVNRPNGRDPIEKYYFSLRYLTMPVNLAAYRALEAGSIYVVYLLPRSERMASIEPKLEPKLESVEPQKEKQAPTPASEEQPSPAASQT
jgi:hypothetical protein